MAVATGGPLRPSTVPGPRLRGAAVGAGTVAACRGRRRPVAFQPGGPACV